MRIMLGYNAFFTCDEVIKAAMKHAKAFNARLYVVTSVAGHPLDEEAEKRLKRLKGSLEEDGLPHEMHLLHGKTPGEDLVRFAKDYNIDEIVIGFDKRYDVGETSFGSNYRYLIARTPCPILTVHHWT
jgi:nucleotide-binding universal stress UspA family protein